MKMSINQYFDKIYCINLKSRPDRWAESLAEFERHNIKNVQRIEGVQINPSEIIRYGNMGVRPDSQNSQSRICGRIGCLLSHLKIIKIAKQHQLSNVLILEDDIQFASNFQQLFESVISEIPNPWALLYFGGNEKGIQEQISERIRKIDYMLMAHAVGIHQSMFDILIETISYCQLPVDVYYAQFQNKFPCYTVFPYLAWQRASFSDIEQRFRIYDFMNKSDFLVQLLKGRVKDEI